MLVALSLLAAACSGSTPMGQVGSTLSAMDGTVTLVKVLYPAPVAFGSIGPALGHSLAAVVLTVHSPTSSPAKFAAIYSNSKLVDSHKLAHIGKSTAKYKVNECLSYPPFSTLPAGQAATGCVVFMLPAAATPVELKISGKAKADWTIAATGFQPGTAPAPLPSEALRPTVPLTDGSGPTTTIAGTTSTTAAPGTQPAGGTTSTAPSTGAASSIDDAGEAHRLGRTAHPCSRRRQDAAHRTGHPSGRAGGVEGSDLWQEAERCHPGHLQRCPGVHEAGIGGQDRRGGPRRRHDGPHYRDHALGHGDQPEVVRRSLTVRRSLSQDRSERADRAEPS